MSDSGSEIAAPKLLVVCNHFLPGFKAGGPIVSIKNLIPILDGFATVFVMCRDRDYGDANPYPGVSHNSVSNHLGYSVIYLSSIIRAITVTRSIKPTVIYLNSFFSPLSWLVIAQVVFSRPRARLIIAPRGELGAGALAIKSKKKRIFLLLARLFVGLNRFIKFHATSADEAFDIKRNLGLGSTVLPNLPTLSFEVDCKRSKIPGQLDLVFLSRISRKKNLHLALMALSYITDVNIRYDIYGSAEDLSYSAECNRLISKLPPNIIVNFRGDIPHKRVPRVLCQYHGLLIPSANENYGHAIAEAMSVGVLPIISNMTPWRDLENLGVGWDFDISTLDPMIKAVLAAAALDQASFDSMAARVRSYVESSVDHSSLVAGYTRLFSSD